MFNNPCCTVVSSFSKGDKMYVTLEFDMSSASTIPLSNELAGIGLGNFKLEVDRGNGNMTLKFYYESIKIAEWSIPEPSGCVNLGEQSFSALGFTVKVKDIQVCIENDHVCLKAGVYVKNPFTGSYNKLGDLNLCS